MMLSDAQNVKERVVSHEEWNLVADIITYSLKLALDVKEKEKLLAEYVEFAEDKILSLDFKSSILKLSQELLVMPCYVILTWVIKDCKEPLAMSYSK